MKLLPVGLSAIVAAAVISVVFAQVSSVGAAMPQGWIKTGSAPQSFDMGVVGDSSSNGRQIAQIKSKGNENISGFATFMQQFVADDYRGKAVRFSAKVRTRDVRAWTGLWMRVDDLNGKITAFDNMQERGITGTTEWTPFEVVLPVAMDSKMISFGILLNGNGEVNMTDVTVEAVSPMTPSTQPGSSVTPVSKQPINLDFKK